MSKHLEIRKILDEHCAKKGLYEKCLEDTAGMLVEKIKELSFIRRMSEAVYACSDLKGACEWILRVFIEETDISNASIMLADELTGELALIAARGRDDEGEGSFYDLKEPFESLDFSEGKGVAGWVFKHKRPMLINDTGRDPRFKRGSRSDSRIGSLFCLPLVVRGKSMGVINLSHLEPGAFKKDNVHFLKIIANHVSCELDNVINYYRLKQLSRELEERVRERTQELEEANRRLLETRDKLVQAEKLRALGQMASGIAHNFNNILAGILGNTQLLIQKVEDPQVLARLKMIETIVMDASHTVGKVQEFSRVRKDKRFVPVDPAQLAREVVEITRPKWKDQPRSKGITIRLELETEEVPQIMGNPSELRELLTNLIFNAVEALPEGGNIRVRVFQDGRDVVFCVTDDGPGIPPEIRDKVFDPFFTTKDKTNSGIGLSIVFGIVNRHGGRISMDTILGEGTNFLVRFPASRAGRSAKGEPRTLSTRMRKESEVGLSVLIVDDDQPLLDILREIMTENGHSVKVAANGREGLERFREGHFDLVITDLGMPELSGFEVAKEVKKLSPDTPVALISGWGFELEERSLAEKGVDYLLSKPFKLERITELLEMAAEKRNAGGCVPRHG